MVKALRLSEEQYRAIVGRASKQQHASGWPFVPSQHTHKFAAQAVDGYDSTLEAKRARELQLLERSGAISDLREQQVFVLIDTQRDPATNELWERPCSYVADFTYVRDGALVVEDCKGLKSGTAYAVFVIKRKLMLLLKGIRVVEIARAR